MNHHLRKPYSLPDTPTDAGNTNHSFATIQRLPNRDGSAAMARAIPGRASLTFLANCLIGCWLLLCLGSTKADAQVTVSLEYTEKNNTTTLLAGDYYTMQLKYAISSTTGNASGVKAVINLPDAIIGISNIAGTTDAPSSNFVFDNTAGAKKVTINFVNPVSSGSTGVLELSLRVNNGTVPNGTSLTTTAELTASGGVTSGVKSHSITVNATTYLCTRKTLASGGALDNTTTYKIRVTANDLGYGGVPLGYLNATNITLNDTLPAGTEFVSAQLVNLYNEPVSTTITQTGNIISAVIPDLIASFGSGWSTSVYELQLNVKYNTSSGFANGQTVLNAASVVYTPVGGSPITAIDGSKVSANACVNDLRESTVLANPQANGLLSKSRYYGAPANVYPGQPIAYCVNFTNTGNIDLNNVEVIETIPSPLYFAGINYATNVIDHFEYQTNLNSTWTTGPLSGTLAGPDPNNPAEYYTKIKLVLISPLPSNAAISTGLQNCLQLLFRTKTEATADTPIQNCAEWTSTTVGIPTSRTVCDNSITLKPRDAKASVFIRTGHTPGCSSPYSVGQQLTQDLTVSVDPGGANLSDPVLMLFPGPSGAFDYVAGSASFNAGTSSLTVTPTLDIIPNYANTGRPLVRWSFPAGTVIPYGTSLSVTAKFEITNRAYTGQQLLGYAWGSNIGSFTHYNGGPPTTVLDIYDLNNNGRTTDTLGYQDTGYNSCAIVVPTSASMQSIKWVKGQLDTAYSRYPASGNTVRGGKADYKLVVTNAGNIPMTKISIIDILPFIGDKGVIDPSARNTQWRPNLAAPISAPSSVTVLYSTAQNPCRDELKAAADPSPFPTGCSTANWSTVPPVDITTVQSVKLDFGSLVLSGGDSLVFTWPMRAPVNAPTNGEIAWNSFGFVATRTDNNQPLLAAEPIKVGIKLAAPSPAFYGDYVWYDTNRNGIQDPGEQGVDGVTVKLFRDKGDNIANPAQDSLIGFTVTGNGGKYLFSNLDAGSYYAIFCPPSSYTVSPANQGSDDTVDSDGTPTTYQGNPAYITAITQLITGEEDLSWDLGIYCGFTPTASSNSPVQVGGTLSFTATGGGTYSWTGPSNFMSSLPNPTIPNVTTANAGQYKVVVDNNGCYANLTVDVLVQDCTKPNAGPDVQICAPMTSVTVSAASNGQNWSALSGNPVAATISQSGEITGMTLPGSYTFVLSAGAGCSDTVQVVRGDLSLTVTPGICNTATNQYTVSGTVSLTNISAGILTLTDGAVSQTLAVGTNTTTVSFTLAGLSSDATSHTVTASMSSCGLTSTTYTAPSACTVAVALTVTPGVCNTATNQYSISGTLSLTNAVAGTATISDGTSSTTVTVAAGATSVPYSLGSFTSDASSHTVTVSYAGKTASAVYTAPSACTVAVTLAVTPGTCNTATNQYSISGTLSLTNAVAGTATISDGTSSTTVTVAAGATSVPYTLGSFNSDASSHTVTVSYAGKTASATYTAPSACTVAVTLAVTPGTCNSATNQYSISGTLSLTNAVAGTATISDGTSSTTVTVAAGATSVAYSLSGFNSDASSHTVTVSYAGQTASATYTAPSACTVAVALTVTPGTCNTATNQYSISGTLSLTNAVAGTATISDGTSSTTVSVAAGTTSVAYSLGSFTSDASSHTVTVSYAGKTASAVYTAPSACTVAVALTVTPGVCNTATNQYSISGTLSLTNAVAGTATISDGTSSATVTVAAGATSVPYTLGSFNSDASSHTVTVSYAGQTASAVYTAPSACTVAVALTVTPGVCNTATNQYSISGTLSLTNAVAGTATISDGTSTTTVTVAAGATSVPYSLGSFNSDASSHTVTVSYAGQTASAVYTAPSACTLGVAFVVTPGTCQSATNQYSISGTLSLTNAPAGTATFTDGTSSTTVAVAAGATSVPFALTGLTSGTGSHTVTASFNGQTQTQIYTAPSACTVAVALAVTPGVCNTATNQYSISGTLSLTNAVAGTATISDGTSSTTVTVAAGATSVPYTLGSFNSDASSHTVTVSYAGQTASATYTAPSACTIAVALSVTPGVCNSATNQYSISGTLSLTNAVAGTATITDGSSTTTVAVAVGATSVAYSLGGFTSDASSHTVTVSYAGKTASAVYTAPSACTLGVAFVVTPGTCQSATNQYSISGTLSLTNAPAGTATFTDGTSSTTVAVAAGATSVPFALTGLISGTGSHTVTASFNGQTQTQIYTAPSACTVAVALTVTPGVCNTATNQYSISGTLSLTNAVAGTATISDGNSSTTVTVAAGATSVAYSLSGFTSDASSHTVTVSYVGKTASAVYTAPSACTLGVAFVVTPGTCQSATNQYSISGTLSLTNAPAGTATFTDGTSSTTVAVAAGATSVPFSLTGLTSGTGSHTVTASFNGQTQTQIYTAPSACTVAVALTVTPGVCNTATNQYSISGTLSLTNAVAGTATISDGTSSTTVTVAAGATSVAYSLSGFNSDASSHTVTVSYVGKTASAVYTAPSACTLGVAFVVTPGTCQSATNQYSISGTLSLTNAPAGTATFTDGTSSTTVAVAAGATSVPFALTGLTSGTGSHTVTASFNGQTQTQIYSAPSACTVAVALAVTPGVCNTATNQYSISGTLSLTNAVAGTATISDGTSLTTVTVAAGATSVPYSLGGFTSDASSHTVTVSYAGKTASAVYTAPSACTLGVAFVVTPGTCQSATNQYSISGTLSLTNAPAGTATFTDGTSSTTVAVTAGQTSVPFALSGLTSGTGSHTVTASFNGQTQTQIYTAPSACTVAVALTVTPGTCNTATNQYSISGTLSLTNAVAGTATISDGTSLTTVTVAAGATSVTYSLGGFTSDASSHTVTVSYAGKTASAVYTAPSACTLGVAFVVTPGTCQSATNQYSISGTLSLTNAPAGTATFTDGTSSTTVAVAAGATSVPFALTGLTSGTGSHTVTASFNGQTQSQIYTAPSACTVAVTLAVTPGTCNSATNQYSISGTLSLTNAVAGTATISDGTSSTTVTVTAGATSVPYSLGSFTSDASSHTVTVSYAGKTTSATYTAPSACTLGVAFVVTPGICQSATNQYSISGTLSLTNAPAGTATFTDGTSSTTVAVTAGQTSVPFALSGLISGTGSHTVTASFNGQSQTQIYTAPSACTLPVLSISKTVSKSVAQKGDVLSYTVTVANTGSGFASNVIVRDSLGLGLHYLANSASAPTGTTFTAGSPTSLWKIGSINPGQTISLTLQAVADSAGILTNAASIPGDTAKVCTSVPYRFCKGSDYLLQLTANPGYSSYQWFRNGVAISGATSFSLAITSAGSYSLSVNNQGGCSNFSCCPVIVEEDTLPTYKAVAIPATCIGNAPQANGQLVISNFRTGYTYQYSLGSTFNEAASLSGTAKVIPANGIIATSLANPATAQAYTVRVYNAAGCYQDVTVLLDPTVCDCPASICVPFVIKQTKGPKRGNH